MSTDFNPSRYTQTFWLAVFFLCIIYTLFNRPLLEVFINSFLIGVSVSAFLMLFLTIVLKKFKKVNLKLKGSFEFLCSLIVSGLFFYSSYTVFEDFLSFYKGKAYEGELFTPLLIATLLLIGLFLFLVRLRLRTVYGLSEVSLGVYIGLKLIPKDMLNELYNPSIYIAIVTASVYLIVRGLDNIHIGLVKGPVDPVGRKIQNFFVDD